MGYFQFTCKIDLGNEFEVEVSEKFHRTLGKLSRRNRPVLDELITKIREISINPEHYKPLKGPMKGYRRVHVRSFVLLYEMDPEHRSIRIEKFEPHYSAYR